MDRVLPRLSRHPDERSLRRPHPTTGRSTRPSDRRREALYETARTSSDTDHRYTLNVASHPTLQWHHATVSVTLAAFYGTLLATVGVTTGILTG